MGVGCWTKNHFKTSWFFVFCFFTVIWNDDSVRNKTFWKWEFKLRTRKKVKQQHISIILKKKNTCFSISVSCDIEDQHYQYYSPGGTHCWCAKHSEEQNRLSFRKIGIAHSGVFSDAHFKIVFLSFREECLGLLTTNDTCVC